MPTYLLVPDEHDFEPKEMIADDARQLLATVYGQGWNSARVLMDGKFVFTVARSVNGMWSILPGLPECDGDRENFE